MARDNAPVPHTCPMIDRVIYAINSVEWEDNYWSKDDLIDLMEDIRSANSTLRNWGNEKHLECNELEDKIYDLENDLKYKAEEIETLNNEINELEMVVSKLENEIYEFSSNN